MIKRKDTVYLNGRMGKDTRGTEKMESRMDKGQFIRMVRAKLPCGKMDLC